MSKICDDERQKMLDGLPFENRDEVTPGFRIVTVARVARDSRKSELPKLPKKREEMDLNKFTEGLRLKDQSSFLLHDRGSDQNRLCLFSSEDPLKEIPRATECYVDETFQIVPRIFCSCSQFTFSLLASNCR